MFIKQILLPLILIALLPLILKLLIKLRFAFALVYIVLFNTIFLHWSINHQTLANNILFLIIALTIFSWCVTIYKKLSQYFGFSKADRKLAKSFTNELNSAHNLGITNNEITIVTDTSTPQIKY